MSADLDAVIAEVALAAAAIPAFADAERRHTGANISRVTPPAVLVEPEGSQSFDATYAPAGMDVYELAVTVVAALLGPNSTWRELSPFLRKSGPSSVRAVLEAHAYSACDAVVVSGYELTVMTFGGNQYLGATFRAQAGG